MHSLVRKRSEKAGLPAGTPVHVGERREEPVRIHAAGFSEAEIQLYEDLSPEECHALTGKHAVTWIKVEGLHDVGIIEKIGQLFGIHPLIVEDILNTEQHPKLDLFDEYLFLDLNLHSFCGEDSCINVEQISMVLGSNFIVTFLEEKSDIFDPVLLRLKSGAGKIRKEGSDYLAYVLIDIITDHYFIVLDGLGEKIEDLEELVISLPSPETLGEIQRLKREMIFLRRSIWPMREIIGRLLRRESHLIGETAVFYLRDVYDHTVQIMETLETYRDMVSGMLDIYLSSVSNRMNEVVKFLTMIGTIFIPLTFIAGVYGMNFQNMPELSWKWGYFGVLGLMAAIVTVMLIYFRRKDWL